MIAEKLNISLDYLLDIKIKNYKLPKMINNKTEAIQFLTNFKMLNYVNSEDDQKMIAFSNMLLTNLTSFKW